MHSIMIDYRSLFSVFLCCVALCCVPASRRNMMPPFLRLILKMQIICFSETFI
jgi:hypothetical protein